MTQPQVDDARNGLRPATIALLQRAEQVSIALRDRDHALLGMWSAGAREPHLVLIRAGSRWGAQTPVPEPLPALHIRDAQQDHWWRHVVQACRVGDVPVLHWWGQRLSLELTSAAAIAGQRPLEIIRAGTVAGAREFPLAMPMVRRRPRVTDAQLAYSGRVQQP